MTTNPEQEARAAVHASVVAYGIFIADSPCPDEDDAVCDAVDAALDLYGRERYLAGKVAGLRDAGHVIVGRCDLDPPCHRCTMTAEAEAEYAACVAALQEAKHG